MRDRPTGDELLETARTVLRDELMPALPADKRHAALMIANALAIAGRQLKNGDTAQRAELDALGRLLSEPPAVTGEVQSLQSALVAANRKLAAWIRAGATDEEPWRDSVRAHLAAVARRKVAESNP